MKQMETENFISKGTGELLFQIDETTGNLSEPAVSRHFSNVLQVALTTQIRTNKLSVS